MARTNWRKKLRSIPATVQIAPKVAYQVVWQKEIPTTREDWLCGTTDFQNRIITIKLDMSPKLTVETFFHECCHAFSAEFDINLTENQVLKMEKILPYLDGLFEKGNK